MKKLMASKKLSTRTIETESSSDEESANQLQHSWTKGINQVQQMYITQTYKRDNGMDSDKEVVEIPDDELKALKKKAKRATKSMSQNRRK